jgi:hypothetical protein
VWIEYKGVHGGLTAAESKLLVLFEVNKEEGSRFGLDGQAKADHWFRISFQNWEFKFILKQESLSQLSPHWRLAHHFKLYSLALPQGAFNSILFALDSLSQCHFIRRKPIDSKRV